MSGAIDFNEDLVRRLPLPVAQLYRRAFNAKNSQERHHASFYLWEAALKLLGSVAVIEYAELGDQDSELAQRLQNLARPSLGHWWEFVRRLVPVLADRGDHGFGCVRDMLLSRARDDLPNAAGLDCVLVQVLEGRSETESRSIVRLTELFDRLVRYRNREIGHGAVGQRPTVFYDRVGRALLAGIPEVLSRFDTLAGRRLAYVTDVHRNASGRLLVERYELRGEASRRLELLDLADDESARRLLPDRLYLETVAPEAASFLSESRSERVDRKVGTEPQSNGDQWSKAVSLHPLLVYDPNAGEALFLNARRGQQQIEYLSYSTGRALKRSDLALEQRELLASILKIPIDGQNIAEWSAHSQAEEHADIMPDADREEPRRLGEFELLSELGRGGMGVVYRAWQPSLGRQVAVKRLNHTGDSKADSRFSREIRALGHVEHPHLVKIFTSGNDGDHWFYSMELVEGVPLAAVCEKLQSQSSSPETVDSPAWQQAVSTACSEARQAEIPLSDIRSSGEHPLPNPTHATNSSVPQIHQHIGDSYIREVVELVRQTADAAHALHERGILHRDIKPGNIMVTADSHQAILMDLGLAQIADEIEGRLTRTRQFVGTLRYASPEQVLAIGGLDRRSDVYNLGATLWELLTLQPMFNATEQTPTIDLMRRIQVEEPERPRKYHSRISRDLEAIALKCLEKDAVRRYPTARELARDLERYQAGEPVHARPVGQLQRAWRWCRRRPAVSGMFATLIVVILGSFVILAFNAKLLLAAMLTALIAIILCSLAVVTLLYVNAERQRRIAQRQEAAARTVTRFYEDHVLAAARPKGWSGGVGKDVTLKEALDQASPKINDAFASQRELEAAVRNTLGMTYYYLGQFDAANPHLDKSYEIRRANLGEEHPDTLASLQNLAMVHWKLGHVKEAIPLVRQALDKRRQILGWENIDTLWTQLHLGLFLEEDNHLDEAETVLREAIEACNRTLGPDHHHTLYGQNDLALVLSSKGKQEESAALDRQTLEGRRRSLGLEHPDTLRSMGNLACTLERLGKLDEAETLACQSLAVRIRVLGPEHEETLWSMRIVGDVLSHKQEFNEAENLYRQTLEIQRRVLGPEHPQTLSTIATFGSKLSEKGRPADAEPLLRECLSTREKKLLPGDWLIANTRSLLGQSLAGQNKFAEAEPLLLSGYEDLIQAKSTPVERRDQAHARIIDLYQKWNKLDQVEAWRKKQPTVVR